VIKSFRSAEAQALFGDRPVARLRAIERPVRRKLLYLSQARTLQDLLVPPENRLEALKGDRKGQHSIRINDQWRICFRWLDGHAYDVDIVDYHS
jgi:proteic killer suppression protein